MDELDHLKGITPGATPRALRGSVARTGACPVCPICPIVDDRRTPAGVHRLSTAICPIYPHMSHMSDLGAVLRVWKASGEAAPFCPRGPRVRNVPNVRFALICSDMSNYGCYVLIELFVQGCPLCSDMSDLSVMHHSLVRPDNGQRGARPICPLWVDKYRDVRFGGVWALRAIRHLWGYCPVMSGLPLSSRFARYFPFDRGSAEAGARGYPYLSPQIIPVIPTHHHPLLVITGNYW